MSAARLEIQCPGCGEETLLRREPVYDGFTRVGESLSCSGCGHRFESEDDVPYKQVRRAEVFSDADKTHVTDVLSDERDVRNCRRCKHYTVNPFTQRCGLRDIEVLATDCCDRFEAGEGGDDEPPADKPDPLAGLFKD